MLRKNKAAVIRHSREKATWPITSALVKLRVRGLVPVAAVSSFRAAATSVWEARNAGTSPNRAAVTRETSTAKPSTPPSNFGATILWMYWVGTNDHTKWHFAYPKLTPATQLTRLSSAL